MRSKFEGASFDHFRNVFMQKDKVVCFDIEKEITEMISTVEGASWSGTLSNKLLQMSEM